MKAEPQKEHQWLHRIMGNWTCKGEAPMEPGKPPVTWTATETVRSIGGVWVMAEGKAEMPGGGEGLSIMTLGYDPAKQRFVGTFVASMMNNLWVYEGTLDEGGNKLTLDTEGPAMGVPGTTARYQDIIEFQSDNQRTLTSMMQGPDGAWTQVMFMEYTKAG